MARFSNWILVVAIVGVISIPASEALKCIKCTSADCNLTGTPEGCTTATSCYSINRGTYIERGCLEDLTPADNAKCNAAEDLSCVTCTSDSCNNANWLKCHTCSDASDCATQQIDETKSQFCPNYLATDQCFSDVIDTTVKRGCFSDLNTAEQTSCNGKKLCETCAGNACNSLSKTTLETFSKCKQCTSPTDAGCEEGTNDATECTTRVDDCYVRLNGGNIERGCLSKLQVADKSKCTDGSSGTECVKCTGDNCNAQKWLKCFKCIDTDSNCAAAQSGSAGFCSLFKTENQCYERLVEDKIQRGCQTDLAAGTDPCSGNSFCRTCKLDSCNRETAESLKIVDRCLKCISSATTPDQCLLGTAEDQPCTKESGGKCYSRIVDQLVHRGCQSELSADDVTKCTGTTCKLCQRAADGAACNKDLMPAARLRCYRCTSQASSLGCQEALTGETFSQYCPKYKESDGCYSRNSGDFLERGCTSDLAEEPCKGLTDKQCAACTGENCNSISRTKLNGAGQLAAFSAFTMLGLIYLVKLVTEF